jgi:hypothetical protein
MGVTSSSTDVASVKVLQSREDATVEALCLRLLTELSRELVGVE